jgi:hypothetical protein
MTNPPTPRKMARDRPPENSKSPKGWPTRDDGSDTWSTWLTRVLDLLGVRASGDLRRVLSSKAAVSFQQGVVRIADFIKPRHSV